MVEYDLVKNGLPDVRHRTPVDRGCLGLPRGTPRVEEAMRTRLKDLPVQAVFEGKNWVVEQVENQDSENPLVEEATEFGPSDLGLFSAIARFSDGSQHPAVVLKSFQ